MIKLAVYKLAGRFFLITLFVITGSINLYAQWIKQSPIPTDKEIRDACFISPDTGWIFGYDGTALRTNDGGESWIDVSLPRGPVITGIFLDCDHGWAGLSYDPTEQSGGIYGTTDGGFNWSMQFYDYSCAIKDISFINPDTGWALACYRETSPVWISQNFFLKTNDGGNTWLVLDSIEFSHFRKMDFIDGSLGYIVGSGTPNMMKTTDGGLTWQAASHISQSSLDDVLFTDAVNGFTCGNDFYFTHDSGVTWGGTNCYDPWKLDMYDESNGWVISTNQLYKVSNGGENVDQQSIDPKSILMAVSAVDSNYAYVTGRFVSIYKTSNGGENWNEISNGSPNSLLSVFFLDENRGWAAGCKSTILRTTDGGEHWLSEQVIGGQYCIDDVQFINPDTGWVVKEDVFRSFDGGKTWNYALYGLSEPVYDLYFLDFNFGFCVGAGGQVYKTINGGNTWVLKNSGTENDLWAVYFVNENTGWIAGERIVLNTTDGGDTWSESYVGFSDFKKIQFLNESVGYILADDLYLKTYTGGEYWHVVVPDGMTGLSLEDICFLDQENGYVSGSNYLLRTTDGGETWTSDPAFPFYQSYAMFFTDELTGWLVGEDGKIYHTETGGTVDVPDDKNKANAFSYTIFPNPARESVKIDYRLEKARDVEIGIYTLTGTEIFNKKTSRSSPGNHTFELDTADFPSGIYILTIKTGAYSETKKIILIK